MKAPCLREEQTAVIVDFTFNLGAARLQTSTLRWCINQWNWSTAAKELRRWIYGGRKELPWLVTRQDAEVALIVCPIEQP